MDLAPEIEASLKVIEVANTLWDAKKPEEIILREVDK